MPPLSRVHALRRLTAIKVDHQALRDESARLVSQLRGYQHPESWRNIGVALGVTAQAAQQRFRVDEADA